MLIVSIVGGVVIMAWMTYEINTREVKPTNYKLIKICEECGSVCLKEKMQIVRDYNKFKDIFYCDRHQKPYDSFADFTKMGGKMRYTKGKVYVTKTGRKLKQQ